MVLAIASIAGFAAIVALALSGSDPESQREAWAPKDKGEQQPEPAPTAKPAAPQQDPPAAAAAQPAEATSEGAEHEAVAMQDDSAEAAEAEANATDEPGELDVPAASPIAEAPATEAATKAEAEPRASRPRRRAARARPRRAPRATPARAAPEEGGTMRITPIASQPEPQPEPAPQLVHVRISTRPRNARLTLDGRPVDNPYDTRTQPSDSHHVFEASAAGYKPRSVRVSFDRDRRLTLRLRKPRRARQPPTPASDKGAGFVTESPY